MAAENKGIETAARINLGNPAEATVGQGAERIRDKVGS